MAYKTQSSLLAQLFIFSILLAVFGHAIAMRDIPEKPKNVDMKQPEWFIERDHRSVLIPGIGRVMLPPYHPYTGQGSISGSIPGGISGSNPGGGGYIPGGDDTLVPNPGFEVPSSGGGVPAQPHP